MYRRLVVPLDGSPFAEHALPFAASIARRAGATLHVVQAHVPVASLYSGREHVADINLDTTIREQETAYLDGVLKRLTESVPLRVNRTLVDGLVADALHEQALAAAADRGGRRRRSDRGNQCAGRAEVSPPGTSAGSRTDPGLGVRQARLRL